MSNHELVPFGKYRGQPIEVLAADKPYCEWLASQDWFRSKFTTIHTLIINNFKEPDETPEHNALQVLFTDPEWQRRFVITFIGGVERCKEVFQKARLSIIDQYKKDLKGWAVEQEADKNQLTHWEERSDDFAISHREKLQSVILNRETWIEHTQKSIEKLKQINPIAFCKSLKFEEQGADVEVYVQLTDSGYLFTSDFYSRRVRVECKPSVGDDYPAILRIMKANSCDLLLIGHGGYTGTGATFEQVVSIFKSASIRVMMLSDINETPSDFT